MELVQIHLRSDWNFRHVIVNESFLVAGNNIKSVFLVNFEQNRNLMKARRRKSDGTRTSHLGIVELPMKR